MAACGFCPVVYCTRYAGETPKTLSSGSPPRVDKLNVLPVGHAGQRAARRNVQAAVSSVRLGATVLLKLGQRRAVIVRGRDVQNKVVVRHARPRAAVAGISGVVGTAYVLLVTHGDAMVECSCNAVLQKLQNVSTTVFAERRFFHCIAMRDAG